jgi:hypothetical protein
VLVGGGDRTTSRGTGAREEGWGAEAGRLAGSKAQRRWRLRSFRVPGGGGGSGALLGGVLTMSTRGAPVATSATGDGGGGSSDTGGCGQGMLEVRH